MHAVRYRYHARKCPKIWYNLSSIVRTIYTRKTKNFITPPTGTDLVRGDGVVVLGAGGLGGPLVLSTI